MKSKKLMDAQAMGSRDYSGVGLIESYQKDTKLVELDARHEILLDV